MSLSDRPFPYGPFVPHWIPKQYLAEYVAFHGQDRNLVLNTTVEDITHLSSTDGWRLTLRKHDPSRNVDEWWQEEFDAVVLANGHYSVPFVSIVSRPLCHFRGTPAHLGNRFQRYQVFRSISLPSRAASRTRKSTGRRTISPGNGSW